MAPRSGRFLFMRPIFGGNEATNRHTFRDTFVSDTTGPDTLTRTMDDYLADDELIGRLICVAIDPAGKPLTSVPNTNRVQTTARRLWKAGIITQCSFVDGKRQWFVHKGQFEDWEIAHEVLERNAQKGIPSPHFPDFLDVIQLEKLGLLEYRDTDENPGYVQLEKTLKSERCDNAGACAIC